MLHAFFFFFCFLEYDQQGNVQLKQDHKYRYYDQVQGQLHICGFEACDFVVKTSTDAVIIRIYKDPVWHSNIEKLVNFFYENLLPYIDDNSTL